MSTSRDQDEWIPMQMVDPELVRRVAGGDYQIDPHAVAEAMLRRSARLSELRRLSRVFVPAHLERSPRGAKKL